MSLTVYSILLWHIVSAAVMLIRPQDQDHRKQTNTKTTIGKTKAKTKEGKTNTKTTIGKTKAKTKEGKTNTKTKTETNVIAADNVIIVGKVAIIVSFTAQYSDAGIQSNDPVQWSI